MEDSLKRYIKKDWMTFKILFFYLLIGCAFLNVYTEFVSSKDWGTGIAYVLMVYGIFPIIYVRKRNKITKKVK